MGELYTMLSIHTDRGAPPNPFNPHSTAKLTFLDSTSTAPTTASTIHPIHCPVLNIIIPSEVTSSHPLIISLPPMFFDPFFPCLCSPRRRSSPGSSVRVSAGAACFCLSFLQ